LGRPIRTRDIDWFLLGLALAIAIIGVVEIYSATLHSPLAGLYKKQIFWIILSCILALVASRLDYHMVLEQIPWLYGISILLLAGLLVAGHRIAGTRRWLQVGSMSFQVSEIVKLIIILVVAAYFADRRNRAVTWGDLVKLGIFAGVPAALVALEPDLGTALTFIPIVAAGVLFAGIRWQDVAILCLAGILALPIGFHFLRPYQRERLMTFIHPTQKTQTSSYQVTQTKIAIGSGGFWGKGLGKGTQGRLGFIPVARADSIFAALAEEQGFVGTLLVLLLYFALLLRLLEGAQTAPDRAGAFLLICLAAVLFFQVVINTGMMIGVFPITGIPLPLMSQGGSSLLFTFFGLGLAMSVKARRYVN
jgi:rod shape determining protein RodA